MLTFCHGSHFSSSLIQKVEELKDSYITDILQAFLSSPGKRIMKLIQDSVVINIQQIGVGTALRWTNMFPEIDCRIIIADGDGTVSLSLDAINELQRKLPVAVLPLGTGNDLSRTLGWRPS
ncbi:unnamed protein product [Brugia pahangi]|uniref:DAGKc domain-containing protein n=1 Tax=Brugia pahangi TaxID=6280 RepID=A0A0N4TN69_BRUPA|nr:unnamed protein product [Brugia pahangi]